MNTERIDITDIATQALNEAAGDAYKASQILEEHAKRDVNLANELLMPLLHQACYDAIRQVCIRQRGYIARQADNVIAAAAADGAKRLASQASRLMDFILPLGQKRLSEATRQDIEANAAFYQRQAKTMAERSRWLVLVARELQGKRKVKTSLTEDKLLALYKEATA
jgi:hypothetical protein